MFTFDVNQLKFLHDKKHNLYFLYQNSLIFDKLRLGDFVMLTTLLFFIKRYIIYNSKGKYNNNNIFFYLYLHPDSEFYLENISELLKFFPHIQKLNNFDSYLYDFSIHKVLKVLNIWQFKELIHHANLKLDNPLSIYYTKHNIIEPESIYKHKIKKLFKNNVVIFPVLHKKYNIERNMNTETIIKMIEYLNKVNYQFKDIYIVNKDNMCEDKIDLHFLENKYKVKILNYSKWYDIILFMIKYGSLYVSGDCGLSHFVAALPKRFRLKSLLFYKTKPHIEKKTIGNLKNIVNLKGFTNELTFIPYVPYIKNDIFVINNQ